MRLNKNVVEARTTQNPVMSAIFKKYSEYYEELYNNRELDSSGETYQYVRKFDDLLKTCRPLISALAEYRHDPFTSDRECASLVKTLEYFGLIS